jgi:WD40 repeat protein
MEAFRLIHRRAAQKGGYGAAELATCGRDGSVRVWDTRQPDSPVAAFEPSGADEVRHPPLYIPDQDLSCCSAISWARR